MKMKFRVSRHEKNKWGRKIGNFGDETTEGEILEKLLLGQEEEAAFSRRGMRQSLPL